MKPITSPIVPVVVALFCAAQAHAMPTVAPGWDLLHTVQPTSFMNQSFVGVQLGSFDFGGGIGILPVGTTDTVVRRLAPAMVPGGSFPATAPPIPIELVALQLQSALPIDLGAGLGYYFITLQSARPGGGMLSAGQMTITFDRDTNPLMPIPVGSFNSFFDVFFDLRIGCLTCSIVFSGDLQISATNVPWGNLPPQNALEYTGVNRYLGGSNGNRDHDFWPEPIFETHPSGAQHTVVAATIPEPASWALMLAGFGLTGAAMRRRHRTLVTAV